MIELDIDLADRERLKLEFLQKLNLDHYHSSNITFNQSYKKYHRLSQGNTSFIVMDVEPSNEKQNLFVRVAPILRSLGFSVPNIYNHDEKNGFLILEDFGDIKFTKLITNIHKYSQYQDTKEIYRNCIDLLMKLHSADIDPALPFYANDILIQELNHFIVSYLPSLLGANLSQADIGQYFDIWKMLLKSINIFDNVFVLREFNFNNLLYLEGKEGVSKIGIVDLQNPLYGSPVYDIVSLLRDLSVDVSEDTENATINYYLEQNPEINRKDFLAVYNILGAQRNSKILGLFAQKALEGDSRYMKSMPRVKKYLDYHLEHPLLSPLKNWMNKVSSSVY